MPRSVIADDALANVTSNAHGVVAGTGNWPSSGTCGPTAVTSTWAFPTCTIIVSPSMPSLGCASLACTTRPTGTFDLGSQLGSLPYLPAEPCWPAPACAEWLAWAEQPAAPARQAAASRRPMRRAPVVREPGRKARLPHRVEENLT